MTLTALLENKKVEISLRDKSQVGAKIAAKFRAKFGTPDRIEVIERGFTIKVMDYPADWLLTKGFKVVENHLKLNSPAHTPV